MVELNTHHGLRQITPLEAQTLEWLETDGLGGFSSGTVSGIRTRRYHALLLSALQPPASRTAFVQGMDMELVTPDSQWVFSTQAYGDGLLCPSDFLYLIKFSTDPWPTWRYQLPDGTSIIHELFLVHRTATVVLRWRLEKPSPKPAILKIRPFFSGRDFHALMHENPQFNFTPQILSEHEQKWFLYSGQPAIRARYNGSYHSDSHWYRQFAYTEEKNRGFPFHEDLGSPGVYHFDLSLGTAALIFSIEGFEPSAMVTEPETTALAERLAEGENRRRKAFITPLHLAADSYLVQRGNGMTIIAGYPWFGDWGRDTFIALRGLVLATRQRSVAAALLRPWLDVISEGMLPNRFSDHGESVEYNSVDASLWFLLTAHEFLAQGDNDSDLSLREEILKATEIILTAYAEGTRFKIIADTDGLLACGEPGVQLTWMDAKIGDWVVTPRTGKPVEIQALWINALKLAAPYNPRWKALAEKAEISFGLRFWNESASSLYDVVDVDHVAGKVDAQIRPNQIFAVGGLPHALISGPQAVAIVRVVEEKLWTPLGLRTLAPEDPAYQPYYEGSPFQRDASYHQGTAWPWLLGAFVDAWVRVRGGTSEAKTEALQRFVDPIWSASGIIGLDHIPEIADARAPHQGRGCPFQAWSLAEWLRLKLVLLDH